MWYWMSSRDASSGRVSRICCTCAFAVSKRLLLFLVVRSGRLVLLRLVVERLVRDAEDLGGFAAVAVGHGERLFDDDALDLFHRLPQRDLHRILIAALARAEQLVGEALDREDVGPRHDE